MRTKKDRVGAPAAPSRSRHTADEPPLAGEGLLGPLEAEVLSWVRRLGPSKVAEVAERVNAARKRPLAYRTVLTVMTRLEAKGALGHEKVGRAYRYFATRSDDQLAAARAAEGARSLLERFGDAALAGFAAELSSDPRRRELLEALLEEAHDE